MVDTKKVGTVRRAFSKQIGFDTAAQREYAQALIPAFGLGAFLTTRICVVAPLIG